MKKIVINALQFKNNSSGIGVVVRDLFGAFTKCAQKPCSVLLMQDAPEFPCAEGTEQIRVPVRYQDGLKRVFFRLFSVGKYCEDAVLLTTDASVPMFLPKSCTLLPLVSDLALYRMPEVYDRSRVMLWKFQYAVPFRQAKYFLAVSEYTKKDMTEILGIPADRIYVVYNSCSESVKRLDPSDLQAKAALDALKEKYQLPEHFVLFIGNNNPRKNLHRIIQAFDRMKLQAEAAEMAASSGSGEEAAGAASSAQAAAARAIRDCQLVIAGEQGWKFSRDEALKDITHKDSVRFIGFVADEDMPALYSSADLFTFPTLYEGFGIPVIEAQRCGVPVLTSDCTSLPEVGGDGAYYVDPYKVDEICEGMTKLLTDKAFAAELVRKGDENWKRFSWEKSAARLAEIIREIEEKEKA